MAFENYLHFVVFTAFCSSKTLTCTSASFSPTKPLRDEKIKRNRNKKNEKRKLPSINFSLFQFHTLANNKKLLLYPLKLKIDCTPAQKEARMEEKQVEAIEYWEKKKYRGKEKMEKEGQQA